MRRQIDINPASAEIARAKTMAAMDRLASEVRRQATWSAIVSRSLILRRRPCFRRWSDRRNSRTKPRDRSGADRENQGIPLDPSRVPMDAADLSAASRRVGRSHRECECLPEQGGWRQDRDSQPAVARPASRKGGGKGARGPPRKSTPSKCRRDSQRNPRGRRAPSARRWSRRYPPAGNRRRCRHLSSRHYPSLRQPRGPGRSDGPAGIAQLQAQFLEGWPSAKEPDIEGVLERFYEVASHRGMARMLAWLILTGESHRTMNPGLLKPAAERCTRAGFYERRRRTTTPELEETMFAATELFILVLGDSFRPEHPPRNRPRRSADSTRRFRRWLSKVLERMESRRPAVVS